ncbi:MAG: type VI secretion system baseplate subunit TssF [Aliidongia sp.]
MVETDPIRGEPCRFRTTYDTVLWPIEIESVRLTGLPLAAPANALAQGARSSLRIVLRTTDPEASFAELGLDGCAASCAAPPNKACRFMKCSADIPSA